jgi:hypothetical protein
MRERQDGDQKAAALVESRPSQIPKRLRCRKLSKSVVELFAHLGAPRQPAPRRARAAAHPASDPRTRRSAHVSTGVPSCARWRERRGMPTPPRAGRNTTASQRASCVTRAHTRAPTTCPSPHPRRHPSRAACARPAAGWARVWGLRCAAARAPPRASPAAATRAATPAASAAATRRRRLRWDRRRCRTRRPTSRRCGPPLRCAHRRRKAHTPHRASQHSASAAASAASRSDAQACAQSAGAPVGRQ